MIFKKSVNTDVSASNEHTEKKTTHCQPESIDSTSVLPASTSMPDISSSSCSRIVENNRSIL